MGEDGREPHVRGQDAEQSRQSLALSDICLWEKWLSLELPWPPESALGVPDQGPWSREALRGGERAPQEELRGAGGPSRRVTFRRWCQADGDPLSEKDVGSLPHASH